MHINVVTMLPKCSRPVYKIRIWVFVVVVFVRSGAEGAGVVDVLVGGLRPKVCASSAMVFVRCGAEGAGVVFVVCGRGLKT